MNMNQLAKKIAMNEELKKQVSIAQIKEILKYTALIVFEDTQTQVEFLKYGASVQKKMQKKYKV